MASTLYEFHLDGAAGAQFREAFPDMQLEELPPGLIVRGLIADESQLLGVLAELQSLGFKVVCVEPVPNPRTDV